SYIGVAGQDVPIHTRIVRHYVLPVTTGAMVISVEPGSPAQSAGLRERDVILEFASRCVSGVDDLHRLLTEAIPGEVGTLKVLRGTDLLNMSITPQPRTQRLLIFGLGTMTRARAIPAKQYNLADTTYEAP